MGVEVAPSCGLLKKRPAGCGPAGGAVAALMTEPELMNPGLFFRDKDGDERSIWEKLGLLDFRGTATVCSPVKAPT